MTTSKEGDLYKIYRVENHCFPIYYGYYAENERGRVEPLPIFPDLEKNPVFTESGNRIVTALQPPCQSYSPKDQARREEWCGDCVRYGGGRDEIGICEKTGGIR